MLSQSPIPSLSGNVVDRKLPFPSKLYKLLEDSADHGTTDIISWSPDGKSFKVHDQEAFTEAIMPSYFSQTKYNSFRRQCYIYGFRLRRDGAFSHPDFSRGSVSSKRLPRMVHDDRRRKRVRKPKNKIKGIHSSHSFVLVEKATTNHIHQQQQQPPNHHFVNGLPTKSFLPEWSNKDEIYLEDLNLWDILTDPLLMLDSMEQSGSSLDDDLANIFLSEIQSSSIVASKE